MYKSNVISYNEDMIKTL